MIAALIAALLAGTALAGKPGKPGGGTSTAGLALIMVRDQNANGTPNWADSITFTFTTNDPTPRLNVTCTQSGVLVYSSTHLMYWPNYWDDDGVFRLESAAWTGGAATCKADLKGTSRNGRAVLLGSMNFAVGA